MYNYFCCRKHPVPVKYAVRQPPGLPDTYASPLCPNCGRTMERYDTGTAPSDPRPVPPPRPEPVASRKLSQAERLIYEGSGQNPGHGSIEWRITRNAAMADITIWIGIDKVAGDYRSQLRFKMADGLIDVSQGGPQSDWWVKAPYRTGPDALVWSAIDTNTLPLNKSGLGTLGGKVIEIGVKLGDARFGLIHLLSGHNKSVRAVGHERIERTGDTRDDVYVTMLSLQAGLKRFSASNLVRIGSAEPTHNKLQLAGSDTGFVVVTRTGAEDRYAITTVYNTPAPGFGTILYG